MRDSIVNLAKSMEFKLDKNKHKECSHMNIDDSGRRWGHLSRTWLHGRLLDEAKELAEAIVHDSDLDAILLECADVANFAMMIHDNTLREIEERRMFKDYVKKGVQPMRPYIEGEDLTGVSVSDSDKELDTLVGGMIARNPNSPDDQWYVAKVFFEENYQEV